MEYRMNTSKIIQYPKAYPDIGVRILQKCEEEIVSIVERSGKYTKFVADFDSRIQLLSQARENANVKYPQWFENLRHVKELYSIHIASVNNMRILYAFVDLDILLLCAFEELEGRGKRTKSYSQYIPVAQKRLREYEEEE